MHTDLVNSYKTIDANFLSKGECENIYAKLISIKDKWFYLEHIPSFYFYPPGMYAVASKEYKNNLIHNSTLESLFGIYYERLRDKISDTLGIQTQYHPNLNLPGFHISTNRGMTTENFHRDRFNNLPSFLSNEKMRFLKHKIFSFILPIKLPTDSESGLLLKTKNQSDTVFFKYHEGALAGWDGDLFHSVKPFAVNTENDFRITMQCHVAISSKNSYIFW